MRRIQGVMESFLAPPTNMLWIYKGLAKYYSNGHWVSLGGSTDVEWEDIKNKPNLSTVATSGDYNDLSNRPQAVSEQANGLMTVALLQKLNGIEANANNYQLPAAGTSIGGVKKATSVANIADPSSATSEVIAQKVNELLAAMRTAGQLSE